MDITRYTNRFTPDLVGTIPNRVGVRPLNKAGTPSVTSRCLQSGVNKYNREDILIQKHCGKMGVKQREAPKLMGEQVPIA